ncbi:unnamed protein product [Miscanthus lutarioriparius]|uniref:Uncharacterized protein n=1 Tax=Miscanthus lutarioriparius TaxID=422564 RepID=A0A811Q519_9POAL|nr:unnamed protein product [Miscanthus lutarioriparius]
MEVGRSLGRSRRPGLRPNSSDASKDKAANLVVLLHKAEDDFGQVQCVVWACPRSCNKVADSLAAHGASVVRSGSEMYVNQVPDYVTNLVFGISLEPLVVCVLVSQCQVSLVNGLIDSLEKAVQTDAGCFLLLNNPTKQKETRARVRQPLASSTSAALAGGGETIEQDTGDPPWPPPLLPPTLLVTTLGVCNRDQAMALETTTTTTTTLILQISRTENRASLPNGSGASPAAAEIRTRSRTYPSSRSSVKDISGSARVALPRSRIGAWVAPESLAAVTSSLRCLPPRRVPAPASWVAPKPLAAATSFLLSTLPRHVGGVHLDCGGGGVLHSDAAGARMLSNSPEAATRINGTAEQLLLFLSPSLMFPWFDMEGEVLRVDLGASCQIRDGLHQIHAWRSKSVGTTSSVACRRRPAAHLFRDRGQPVMQGHAYYAFD